MKSIVTINVLQYAIRHLNTIFLIIMIVRFAHSPQFEWDNENFIVGVFDPIPFWNRLKFS